ncbi:hypothetical protein L3X38_000080 [Prunus dulcis]|uniref:Uncharacterized protein n=1 Tax=Prunus dulcis TaxID=3755 RepID=A0AAD4UQF8_PRUDU|nr:hypothetical protein L3X38_000080 [Prunus dulcis]
MWDLTIHPLKESDVLVGTLAPHERVALIPNCHTPDRLRRSKILSALGWLHSHQPARFCFWELTKQLPRVVTHPGIAPASHSLNFGVLTTPKPESDVLVGTLAPHDRVALIPNCHTPDRLRRSKILSALGWLHSHQPARFCFWELTKQLPRVVTHPGIAPASHSLNFGVLTTPKPESDVLVGTLAPHGRVALIPNCHIPDRLRRSKILSALGWLHSHQPARFYFWELTKQLLRVVTHPGIAPASNSLNFGVPTTPKPVSSQKASYSRCLLGAHWLRSCKNSEVKRVGGWSNPRMGDHPGKLLREIPETKPFGLVRM